MFLSLLSKFSVPVVLFLVGTLAGIYLQEKVIARECKLECPKAPDCNCPAPTVQMQPFEVDKMKNIKGFTYSPQYSGNISIGGADTTRLREIVEKSITKALKGNSTIKKAGK